MERRKSIRRRSRKQSELLLSEALSRFREKGCQLAVAVTASERAKRLFVRSGGRAEARSKSIAAFQGQPWLCDWQYVVNQAEQKWVDLRDPFASRHEVSPLSERIPQRARPTEFEDFVARIAE